MVPAPHVARVPYAYKTVPSSQRLAPWCQLLCERRGEDMELILNTFELIARGRMYHELLERTVGS